MTALKLVLANPHAGVTEMLCSLRAVRPAQLRQALLGALTQLSPPAEGPAHMPAWCQNRGGVENSARQCHESSGAGGAVDTNQLGTQRSHRRSLSLGRVFSVTSTGVNEPRPQNARRRHTVAEAEGAVCGGAEGEQAKSATALKLRESGLSSRNPVGTIFLSSFLSLLLYLLFCFLYHHLFHNHMGGG